MERENHIRILFDKYLNRSHTPAELDELLRYFDLDQDQNVLTELIDEVIRKENTSPVNEQLVEQIALNLENKIFSHTRPKTLYRKLLPWLSAAAILLLTATYFIFSPADRPSSPAQPITAIVDVPAGSSKATLTFSSGKAIALSGAKSAIVVSGDKITYDDGSLVLDRNNQDITGLATLSTPKGGEYKIVLPDGTKVWLNAATTLQYAANLRERGKRSVKLLAGEAYFEVSKDKKHPFVVTTATQEVEVLGTHFNISSYPDESNTITTLAEGSVKVSSTLPHDKQSFRLKPGEQTLNNGKGVIMLQPANLEMALAWKNGQLYFEDTDLRTVMRTVSRWYNIDVEYKTKATGELLSGGVSRQSNLSAMVKVLQLSGIKVTLSVKGNNRKLIIE